METSKNQSLADHTFNVVAIVRRICTLTNIPQNAIVLAALDHDIDEIFTGDMPTLFKRRLKSTGVKIHEPFSSPSVNKLTPREKAIIKVADVLEAMWFVNNYGVGPYASRVKTYMVSLWEEACKNIDQEDTELFDSVIQVYQEVMNSCPTVE